MQIVEPSYEIITPATPEEGKQMIRLMERAGRTCYKNESKITDDSAEKFVSMLRDRNHHAMLEFGWIVVKFICSRGISHELVRHRLCSFAQESTRYVGYSGTGITVICSDEISNDPEARSAWENAMHVAEESYNKLIAIGLKPQIARDVLPTCLKTEIVVSANTRQWRHVCQMRTPITAHPQMRQLMQPLLSDLQKLVPVLYDDIEV